MAGATDNVVANSHDDGRSTKKAKGKTLSCRIQLLDGDELTFDVDVSSFLVLSHRRKFVAAGF